MLRRREEKGAIFKLRKKSPLSFFFYVKYDHGHGSRLLDVMFKAKANLVDLW